MSVNRLTSRVLLFDRDDRILLFLTKAPDTSGVARWLTPGGGVDPGETHHEAALRELLEETGLVLETVGDPVWTHDFVVEWDAADHDTGHAEFYTAVVDAFEPSDELWTDEERVDVLAHRWWSLDELGGTDEVFEPAELLDLMRRLLPSIDSPRISEGAPMTQDLPEFTIDELEELNDHRVPAIRQRGCGRARPHRDRGDPGLGPQPRRRHRAARRPRVPGETRHDGAGQRPVARGQGRRRTALRRAVTARANSGTSLRARRSRSSTSTTRLFKPTVARSRCASAARSSARSRCRGSRTSSTTRQQPRRSDATGPAWTRPEHTDRWSLLQVQHREAGVTLAACQRSVRGTPSQKPTRLPKP